MDISEKEMFKTYKDLLYRSNDLKLPCGVSQEKIKTVDIEKLFEIINFIIDYICIHDRINEYKNAKTENVLADIMEILIAELKKDKEPGSYYHGWQSNLAMKILDNCDNKLSAEKCNDIAVKFLDYLIEQGE